jgi:antitoxin component of RelBE/YafQ-DinJ toxin-antitoxin module
MKTEITVQIDKKIKNEVEALIADMGYTLSDAVIAECRREKRTAV